AKHSRKLMWSPMPRPFFLLGVRPDPLAAIRLRTSGERDDALRLADRIIAVPHAKLDHVTNIATLFLSGAILHTLYVGQRLGERIALEDIVCSLSTEPAPAMRLYEVMWSNRHGTPTAAGFIEDVPNAAVSDVGELMLDQRLNDILVAHGVIERSLARYIR
ncbi:MAG: hypothetical protein ACREFN_19550, partial [Acetobacteraceae bacterium]